MCKNAPTCFKMQLSSYKLAGRLICFCAGVLPRASLSLKGYGHRSSRSRPSFYACPEEMVTWWCRRSWWWCRRFLVCCRLNQTREARL